MMARFFSEHRSLTASVFSAAAVMILFALLFPRSGEGELSEKGSSASPKKPKQAIVWYQSIPSDKTGPRGPEQHLVMVFSDGSWKKTDVMPEMAETTQTVTSGALEPAEAAKLFSEVKKAVGSIKPNANPAAAKSKQKENTALALFGFKSPAIYLRKGAGGISPGFSKIESLLKAVDFSLKKKTGAKKKVEFSSWTMMGEGAQSASAFDSAGNYMHSYGGDIGCGYDYNDVIKTTFDQNTADSIFKQAGKVVKDNKLEGKMADGKQKNKVVSGGEAFYTLTGFAAAPIELFSGEPGYDEIAALVVPLSQKAKGPATFFVWKIEFNATIKQDKKKSIKTPEYKDIRAELNAGGLWLHKNYGEKESSEHVKPKKINMIFSGLRQAVDIINADPDKAAIKDAPNPTEGVRHINVFAFTPEMGKIMLAPHHNGEQFLQIKTILDKELFGIKK